jgi:NRAMP (natural resistance-associated macrophage protein)-like metal ion transporter
MTTTTTTTTTTVSASASTEAPIAPQAPPPLPAISAPEHQSSDLKQILKSLGPGLITGASDDDPSGIGTYAVAGASLGYATLWTALASFPMMTAVQYTCAKIGMVSGTGLAAVLRQRFPRPLVYAAVLALVTANSINAGADIGAIAAAINLLVPIPLVALIVPIGVTILALQIFGSYAVITRCFKWLTLGLLAYIGAALFAHPDWGDVLRGTFVPTFSLDPVYVSTLVAIFGTTISPYMFFWQPSQEVEEEIEHGRVTVQQRRGASDRELRAAAADTRIGMFFSNLIMYFIILATGATLFQAGQTHIASAADAAEALRPLAGDAAALLLAVGLIGSGFLAVPVLTSSSAYAVAETFGWKEGLGRTARDARGFYGVIVAGTVVGMLFNFAGVNPIDALFWTAVLNGFLAPPLLVLVMLVANDRQVMGRRTNGRWLNVLGWGTTLVMFAAAIGLVATWGR